MEIKILVKKWFEKWLEGDFQNLPVSEDFRHTSPFVIISGKENYIKLVESNKDGAISKANPSSRHQTQNF